MGGSNSKYSTFDEHPKTYRNIPGYCHCKVNEKNWNMELQAGGDSFSFRVKRPLPKYEQYEVVYQLIFNNNYHLRRKRVFRGFTTLGERNYFRVSSDNIFYNYCCEPRYNQFNFQAFVYVIKEKNGLRKLNFEDKNVYGKSKTLLKTGGNLQVPIQFLYLGAPLLAKHVDKRKQNIKFKSRSEEFFQVFHGVHVQLNVGEIKSLLKSSAKFQVLNVKRYCEQHLIRRDDLEVSEEQKFELACEFNLNFLMNQVLRNVETIEDLAKFVSIAIETESMDTNISKLLIAKMFKFS